MGMAVRKLLIASANQTCQKSRCRSIKVKSAAYSTAVDTRQSAVLAKSMSVRGRSDTSLR